MSIDKKNKDHLKEHAGVTLIAPVLVPKSDDFLCFSTNHPIENTFVDLRPFADGEFKSPHPTTNGGTWGGPFTGRPKLIAELAPALEARSALLTNGSIRAYMRGLRAWWRFFDAFESNPLPGGDQQIVRVESLADLKEFHEVAALRLGISSQNFSNFVRIVNDARRLLRLPKLTWVSPRDAAPVRTLIPEDQARELKTALKQDWERVRKTWAQNDTIRAEAEKRVAGEAPSFLGDDGERLLMNWQHFRKVQQETGLTLPTGEHLLGKWKFHQTMIDHGFEMRIMRAILFPTAEEAGIAFHLALMNSGWNPSTLSNLDAASPFLASEHPKNEKQLVLSNVEDEVETLRANKPRARGKPQFCTALKKHSSSSPFIVAAYLKRVELLRDILKKDYHAANVELARMQTAGEERLTIEKQFKLVQKIRRGCHSVWLYLDQQNRIKWIDGMNLPRYYLKEKLKFVTYLELVIYRINIRRIKGGKALIPRVKPSDFRDIYARWVYLQTGGNILAVMLALGHSSFSSTGRYLDNNIFSAENDEHARRFLNHLFAELEHGRVDLTILAQLVRHGTLTPEMEARLVEYRQLMRSRIGVGCVNPRHPPSHVAPSHVKGRLCGTHLCLNACPHARFLPESLDGTAMRVEELLAMSDHLPRETWLRGGFQEELNEGEVLLDTLYAPNGVAEARNKWRMLISTDQHAVPGMGRIASSDGKA
ncbi:MAG: hypothetical protein LUQ11_10235 [Methylococcaceae bacterium]|nr:hypothetical protein [Methylococcaceae bacterium]